MAAKRCFSPKVVQSDAFLNMPDSAQNLYYNLNFAADDDGFVNSPHKVMRMLNKSESDLDILIDKKFILSFDSGIIVIKHWRMHNTLRNDRYKPTDYQDEYAMLEIKSNKSYTWKQNGNKMETFCKQNGNITKHNITEHNITDSSSIVKRFKEAGYSDEFLKEATNIFNTLDIKESFVGQSFIEIIEILENNDIYKKQEYTYTRLKKKGWLNE